MADTGISNLFVYGSLRSGFKSPAYEYISRYFNLVGDAKVRGKLYDMGEYPAAVPTQDDSFIIGELYTVKNQSEFSWAIGQLDDYEGMNVEADELQLYMREPADILIADKVVTAWVYWFKGDVTGKPHIDSGDILKYVQQKKSQ